MAMKRDQCGQVGCLIISFDAFVHTWDAHPAPRYMDGEIVEETMWYPNAIQKGYEAGAGVPSVAECEAAAATAKRRLQRYQAKVIV